MEKIDGSCGCGMTIRKSVVLIAFHDGTLAFILMYLSALFIGKPRKLNDIFGYNVFRDYTVVENVLALGGSCSFLLFIFSILLLLGVICRSPKLILPWIMLKPVSFIVFNGLIWYIHMCVSVAYGDFSLMVLEALSAIFVTSSIIYKFIVVRLYYKSLKKSTV